MMMNYKLKPQTIARRKRERVAAIATRKAVLIERLTAKVKEHGDDSIWAEMLQETSPGVFSEVSEKVS